MEFLERNASGQPHSFYMDYGFDYYFYNDSYMYNYDLDYYEKTVGMIHKVKTIFTVVTIAATVINVLLLLTAISKTARSCSVHWYMYHIMCVTVLQAIIALVRNDYHEAVLSSNGLCLFLSFVELAVIPITFYSVVLMDFEVLKLLAPIYTSVGESVRRFVISTNATWIASLLFAILTMFFGNEIEYSPLVCFIVTKTTHLIIAFISQWIPCFIIVICSCVGCGLFIRGKLNPESYQYVTEERTNNRSKTELFMFFILWNSVLVLSKALMLVAHEELHFSQAFIVEHACMLVHYFIPVLSLTLPAVRTTIKNVIVYFWLGRTNVSPSTVTDIVALHSV